MAVTIEIVLRTIPEWQIFTFPIDCSCYFPSAALSLVQDSMPRRFLCELKKFASVCSQISSHMAIILRNFCIMLLFEFKAWLESEMTVKGCFIKRIYHLT